MLDLLSIGSQIGERRTALKLSQTALSSRAGVSRATVDALENGRAGELGFTKITRLLAAVGLELKLQAASSQRPTLEELLEENRSDITVAEYDIAILTTTAPNKTSQDLTIL